MKHRRLAHSVIALLVMALAGPALAHPGWGIVEDKQGNIYYTDLHQVWKRALDGRLSIAVANVHTHELYLDAAGNLFGEHLWYEGEKSDRWGHRVWRLSPDGRITDVVPPTQGFRSSFSFVRDASGSMYWAANGLVYRQLLGSKRELASRTNFGDIRSMAASPNGEIFVVAGSDLFRIGRGGATRRLASDIGESAPSMPFVGEHHQVMGLWVDKAGAVYAAVFGGQKVKRVTPQGRIDVVARSTTPWSPSGGMIARNGDLWLLEYSLTNQARIRNADRPDQGRPAALLALLSASALVVAGGLLLMRRRLIRLLAGKPVRR